MRVCCVMLIIWRCKKTSGYIRTFNKRRLCSVNAENVGAIKCVRNSVTASVAKQLITFGAAENKQVSEYSSGV